MGIDKKVESFPIIALRDLVIFPHMVTHFDAGRSKSIKAIEEAEMQEGKVFLLSQKDANKEEPEEEDLFTIGTIATVKQILRLPGGIVRVLVEGEQRGRLLSFDNSGSFLQGEVEWIEEEEEENSVEIEALMRMVEEDVSEYVQRNNKLFPGLLDSVIDKSNPSTYADTIGGYIDLQLENSQKILEAITIPERLIVIHEVLSKELEILAIENQIDQKVKDQMTQAQKEYYLKEQIRVIRDELGEGDDEEDQVQEYRTKLEEKDLPEEVREKAEKELRKLSRMNMSSPEYAGITNYLDWVLDLPWLEGEEENIQIEKARRILDEDHYGLKEVKERILEFIAVRKRSEKSKGPNLCLVGPPGVGKTSIARSIARALDKEYVRMSLGGITDESEIRGHRRTYIGSMPGRVITLMKQAGENNPLFLLDEIDKVGNDYKGDPASGLLEVLDPAQNNTFTDRFMEVPFDLSNVFFLTTANTTRTIPSPLLDRMEVIEIGGYTPEEKFHIAKRYLVPRNAQEANISEEEFQISDNAIRTIIDYYTREAGVRNLDKEIAKIIRKISLELLEKNISSVSISNRNLSKYLGKKKYLFDLMEEKDTVGFVNGLAWTAVGGVTLGIEVNITPGKGRLKLTGKLGEVMKESAQAALTYIWSKEEELGIDSEYKDKHDIHIHIPEGATPKDGPSAGITMATALYSAISGRKVRRDIAMTGEITLRGRVLGIGGLKEKLLAAHRMGIKKVIIPKENESDIKELDSPSLSKLEIVTVESMEEVLREAIRRENP
ncbi:endopeptidase La [Peptoniphilus sp. KCTC 25270]|uniref:endopeptidase La n=1 Tax=Peptoniphilus sp. KCTC 25270 TaxID=2897414 RepID=UPI001E4D5E58|nr:endopeptidase La [Peptoniphilus sp. KCTC 25270]MCD1146522.1 endopeptidase La [Peptoniphilus sp. KCTC 25270]